MRTVILFNPRSGRGRAPRVARFLQSVLVRQRIPSALVRVGTSTPDTLDRLLPGCGALIVVGGDGTVHHAAVPAARARVPLYHFPLGTENLFARQFGMTRNIATLLAALRCGHVVHMDLARCNASPCIIMCSAGPDAAVMARMSALRRRSITHLAYLRPIAAEFLHPQLEPLSIHVDARQIVADSPGLAVVANCHTYALSIDPARKARPADGLLDLVFFPAQTCLALVPWLLAARMRTHTRRPGLICAQGRSIRIDSPQRPVPIQIDGEAMPDVPTTPVHIEIDPIPVPVLVL